MERKRRAEEARRAREEKRTKKVTPEGGRWEFRFKDVKVDAVVRERDRKGVGVRYGVPPQDRKKGQIKIPKRVDCI